jgi:hypothetical protein
MSDAKLSKLQKMSERQSGLTLGFLDSDEAYQGRSQQAIRTIRVLNAHGKVLTEEISSPLTSRQADAPERPLNTAEVHFALQPAEHVYGSGQFQDGYLDIARLPRKLVQLNTQISIPFFLSSRGYGILWHNYGMTELNRPDNHLVLTDTGTGAGKIVDVTSSSDVQSELNFSPVRLFKRRCFGQTQRLACCRLAPSLGRNA